MSDAVLALNAGSSSIKFALFRLRDAGPEPLLRGLLEEAACAPRLRVNDANGATLTERGWDDGTPHETRLGETLDWIDHHLGSDRLVGIGHRIVHGGERFTGPVLIDDDTLAAIDALTPLAPLHQPRSLAPIRAMARLRPRLPQVGCFDTAFHHTLAPVVRRYAIPRRFEQEGLRKYGFHGLSYAHIAERLGAIDPTLPAGRTIVAHLGNGASLCALQDGASRDTTMGFSALDGLVMGTRPGALDPGIVLHLQRTRGMSAEAVEKMLYHDSGLLGVSGLSSDMRSLAASDDPHAREAIELFVFRIARETGALAATLGGLDSFVFTGGIGEHDAALREAVAGRLAWLGLAIDPEANRSGERLISRPDSRVATYVIPADEERVIARETAALVRGHGPTAGTERGRSP